jgi:hypothetical protein
LVAAICQVTVGVIIAAWPTLPEPIKRAMLALVS